jgi:RHS repeat-associated protein
VVAEIRNGGGSWIWSRGYVYWPGGELLAVQQGVVRWVHRDPVVKSARVVDVSGQVESVVELDPWGGETERSENPRYHPYVYGGYERDGNWSDQAQRRVYHGWYSRFYQPDPWEGSYDLTDPQSFNRYTYVQNDPVNFIDPDGLLRIVIWGVACTQVGNGPMSCEYYIEQIIDLPDPRPITEFEPRPTSGEPREPQPPNLPQSGREGHWPI